MSRSVLNKQGRLGALRWVAGLSILAAAHPAAAFPGTNDSIFPPAASAKPHIDFDNKGFLIDGRRTFLVGGDMHYSRVPHELWRDRLLRMKRAGYNVVQTYAFWNFHEPRDGQWDYSGDHDLEAFLKLAHELGMYAVVRVGPYINAEWDSGGLPVWLRFKPWMAIDTENQAYYQAMDAWYEKVFGIIARNQVDCGGPVILVQLTNEDARGAGTDVPNGFFVHLRDTALRNGLTVPYFFSGVNHGDDPTGHIPVDVAKRKSPWFSSEFWTGWFNMYKPDDVHAHRLLQGTWHTIALGGTGYAHYMMVGGTNFGSWNSDEVGASYDYGAPIGEGGDLRDDYYGLKRAGLFAESFGDVLADSTNAFVKDAAVSPNVRECSRRSPNGTILFLENPDPTKAVSTRVSVDGQRLPSSAALTINPGEIFPVITHYRLAPSVMLKAAAARVLNVVRQGDTTSVIIFGRSSERAELEFSVTGVAKPTMLAGRETMSTIPGGLRIRTNYPASGVRQISFQAGKSIIRVLAMDPISADRTWTIDKPTSSIIVGPDYVGDVDSGGFQVEERPGATPRQAMVYGEALVPVIVPAEKALAGSSSVPSIAQWQFAPGTTEADPGYSDIVWKASDLPLPLGADGSPSPYAWYRFQAHAPRAGKYRFSLDDAGDWLSVFVNGAHVASTDVRQRFKTPIPQTVDLPLKAGQNTVAIFAAHYGRNKLYAYHGDLTQIDVKGINGSASLYEPLGSESIEVGGWRRIDVYLTTAQAASPDLTPPPADGESVDVKIGDDVFHGRAGFAWFRATLRSDLTNAVRRLHFEGVDDNATVFLNGKRLFHNEGWNQPFDVTLSSDWIDGADNVLDVLVENTNQGGGISKPVTLSADRPGRRLLALGWKMRGDIHWPDDDSGAWQSLGTASTEGPAFYRSEFTLPSGPSSAVRIMRFSPTGLSRGMVRLNGHDLGRYPDKVASPGLYMPECWLRSGANVIEVFDEEGASPATASIIEEPGSGRDVYRYSLPASPLATLGNGEK